MVAEPDPAFVTRRDLMTVALAAGTVYNVVSVAALGMEYFLKYLFAMSNPVHRLISSQSKEA